MGVLGLTPFLQKTCPEVIKYLPERLKSLSGSRIVIDGTLITQRLHFVALPNPYRHVLGWYRLVKELQDNNVSAICVFDGKERNIAKAKEAVRRQEVRRLTSAREIIENDRLERLRNLGRLINNFRALEPLGQSRVAHLIRESVPKDDEPLPFLPPDAMALPTGPDIFILGGSALLDMDDIDIGAEEILHNAASYISVEDFIEEKAPDAARYNSYTDGRSHESTRDIYQYITSASNIVSTSSASIMDDEGVANSLISLYKDFRSSIPKLASISAPPVPATPDDPEVATEYMMSKGQYQLTLDEGQLWDRLRQEDETQLAVVTVEETLQKIYDKSSYMSDSYARRTKTPTMQTYAECREILVAMGIPCIEAEGPYEAEALASSLVLKGYADYVASEDTDVIVYDAPLLRNLTNRQGPLMIVSGPDVRAGLDLSRDSFVDFALLLGTDFSQRIKNVGPARALKFIKQHGTIERIVEEETKYPPRTAPELYLEEVNVARTVFQSLPPVPQAVLQAKGERDEMQVMAVMARYNLLREVSWDHGEALSGNFFGDNPSSGAEPDATTHGLYVQ